jgi:hypothetical protein
LRSRDWSVRDVFVERPHVEAATFPFALTDTQAVHGRPGIESSAVGAVAAGPLALEKSA